jgi:iron(III) transport system ATP-binding protein
MLRETLGRELLRVVRLEGASALLVTHDQHSALSLADRVVVMDGDQSGSTILQDASAQQVYQQPATEAVAVLTGDCTVIDAVAHGESAETALGSLPLTHPRTGSVRLVLRPHQLRFVPDEEGAFRLSNVRYTGTTYRLSCDGPCPGIEAETDGSQTPPAVGTVGRIEAQAPCWSF